MRVTTDGTSAVANLLDQLYAAGVIEEELDDCFAWQTSDGIVGRTEATEHVASRTGSDHFVFC